MKEVFVKKKLPETSDECGEINCDDCAFNCGCHAESIFQNVSMDAKTFIIEKGRNK